MTATKPILFLFGPSGAGKSQISQALRDQHRFLHFDIDKKQNKVRGFALNQFPSDWDHDITNIDFQTFATQLRRRVDRKRRRGAVVSFPTIHVLAPEQIESASRFGIATVVLWGTEEQCIESRRKRRNREEDMPLLGLIGYKEKNRRSFEAYAHRAYDKYRVDVFRSDGTHWPVDHNLSMILAQVGWTLDTP